MQTLALAANLLGLAFAITASLIKGKSITKILILILLANSLIATGYFLSGTGINGAASCLLACIQTLINFLFEAKNKPLPKALLGIYLLSFVAVNILVGGVGIATLVAILACAGFVASISQKSGMNYRICAMINCALWVIYDIITASYSALLTHSALLSVNIIGFLIHDIKEIKKAK